MVRRAVLGVLACAVLAGCQGERFSSVRLGDVEYGDAYRTAVATFRDYYSIASTEPADGRIVGRPKSVTQPPDRLMSGSQARELAEMRLRTTDGALWADMRVLIQRQGSLAYSGMTGLTTQHELPNQTPAQLDAPLTTEQRQAWETTGTNRVMERRILGDLYKRLHPTPEAAP